MQDKQTPLLAKSLAQPLAEPTVKQWHIYLVRCADGSLYAGVSIDPVRRCIEHNQQRSRASRYVWARRPANLVWQRAVANHSQALQLEIKLKRLTKAKKEQLLQLDTNWHTLLAPLKTAP